MLMMLAFLVDQVQQLCCPLFRAVWEKWGASGRCGTTCVRCFAIFASTRCGNSTKPCWTILPRKCRSQGGTLLTHCLRSRQRERCVREGFLRPTLNVFRRRFPAHDRRRHQRMPSSLPPHVILRSAHTRHIASTSTENGTDHHPPHVVNSKHPQSALRPGIADKTRRILCEANHTSVFGLGNVPVCWVRNGLDRRP